MKKRKNTRFVAILLVLLFILPVLTGNLVIADQPLTENNSTTELSPVEESEESTTELSQKETPAEGPEESTTELSQEETPVEGSEESTTASFQEGTTTEESEESTTESSQEETPAEGSEESTTESSSKEETPTKVTEGTTSSEPSDENSPSKELNEDDENNATISFDTNGGNLMDPIIVEKGQSLNDLPVPSKDGYLFLGWFDENNQLISTPLTIDDDIVLHAVWDVDYLRPDNPDHLTEPDDSSYAGELIYNFPSTSLPKLLTQANSLAGKANNPPTIGKDHPTQAGEVMLFKEATPVEGKVNTWDITLRVEACNKPTTTDVVLVIDRSGSMEGEPLRQAKEAANAFIENLLQDEHTHIGIVSFASGFDVYSQGSLTREKDGLKNYISRLKAGGGTFTQGGIKQAELMLEKSTAEHKHIVLLSDGEPTFSYKISNPQNYKTYSYYIATDVYGHSYKIYIYATNSKVPQTEYNYGTYDKVGDGTFILTNTYSYYPYKDTKIPLCYYHGNSAIAEAGFAKVNSKLWSIGLNVNSGGKSILKAMASPNSYYDATPENLQTVFNDIASQIRLAVNDATVKDPMGPGFKVSDVNNIKVTQETTNNDEKEINWTLGTLTTPLTPPIKENPDIVYAESTYRVEITDDILEETPDEKGEYPTNGDATISYTDAGGKSQNKSFPNPRVNPVFYEVIKELQDKDGKTKQKDQNFTIGLERKEGQEDQEGQEVYNRSFTLNPSESGQVSTGLQTDLRDTGDYTFEEKGDPSNYDVTYYVNVNDKETKDRIFNIKDNFTKDVHIKVVNKEKPGSLTITKVLDQSVVKNTSLRSSLFNQSDKQSNASFEFTVTGPNDYSQTFTLPDEKGNWEKTLDGLAQGNYTVTETTSGYETTMQVNDESPNQGNTIQVTIGEDQLNQKITVTNKQTENMTVTANKIWEGGPKEKPEIWFQLIRINNDKTTIKIGKPKKVTNNRVIWKQTDEGLADFLLRYDENGNEYSYKVIEVDADGEDYVPENYSKTEDRLTVTNTYKKASIEVRKVWDDGDDQDGIRPGAVTIKLLADGQDTGKTLVLSEVNNWTATFTDLDEYKGGKEISYSVEEVDVAEGYTPSYTDSDEGYVVTNSHTPEKISVSGSKTWDDNNNQDGTRPAKITIRLLKNGKEIKSQTVTADDNWEWSFTNLAKYEKGEEINYSISEKKVEGYSQKVSGYDVTNTHTPGKTSIQVTKAWADKEDQDGIRPGAVTIKLLADGQDTGKTLVLSEANNWTATFTDLDEYKGGKEISYSVEEVDVAEGYTPSYTDSDEGYVVTNSHTPEKISVSGSKTWDDNNNQDGTRPAKITIHLVKNGKEIKSQTVTAEDNWSWTFANLPKYDNGQEITYTVTEDAVEEYSSEVSGYDVTNTHTPGKTSVQVTKAWLDNNNQDGKRPESVTIKLLADGADTGKTISLTAGNNWTGTFQDLDKYKDGQEISYTVQEEEVDGYTTSITGDVAKGYIVNNSRTPETVTISGTKTWQDKENQDGKRPESITIRLKKNGQEIDSKTVTAEDNWSWSFTNLPKYDKGQEITYTVTEDAVDEYSSKVSGFNVTNTYTPGKTSVQVTKAWDDGDNQDGLRPESVTIRLLADGKDTGKIICLSEENDWTGTFSDLDVYQSGQKINYTVQEEGVDGYTSTVSGDMEKGFVVMNVHEPKPSDHPSTPTTPSEPVKPTEPNTPTEPTPTQPSETTPITSTGESLGASLWIGISFICLALLVMILKWRFKQTRK